MKAKYLELGEQYRTIRDSLRDKTHVLETVRDIAFREKLRRNEENLRLMDSKASYSKSTSSGSVNNNSAITHMKEKDGGEKTKNLHFSSVFYRWKTWVADTGFLRRGKLSPGDADLLMSVHDNEEENVNSNGNNTRSNNSNTNGKSTKQPQTSQSEQDQRLIRKLESRLKKYERQLTEQESLYEAEISLYREEKSAWEERNQELENRVGDLNKQIEAQGLHKKSSFFRGPGSRGGNTNSNILSQRQQQQQQKDLQNQLQNQSLQSAENSKRPRNRSLGLYNRNRAPRSEFSPARIVKDASESKVARGTNNQSVSGHAGSTSSHGVSIFDLAGTSHSVNNQSASGSVGSPRGNHNHNGKPAPTMGLARSQSAQSGISVTSSTSGGYGSPRGSPTVARRRFSSLQRMLPSEEEVIVAGDIKIKGDSDKHEYRNSRLKSLNKSGMLNKSGNSRNMSGISSSANSSNNNLSSVSANLSSQSVADSIRTDSLVRVDVHSPLKKDPSKWSNPRIKNGAPGPNSPRQGHGVRRKEGAVAAGESNGNPPSSNTAISTVNDAEEGNAGTNRNQNHPSSTREGQHQTRFEKLNSSPPQGRLMSPFQGNTNSRGNVNADANNNYRNGSSSPNNSPLNNFRDPLGGSIGGSMGGSTRTYSNTNSPKITMRSLGCSLPRRGRGAGEGSLARETAEQKKDLEKRLRRELQEKIRREIEANLRNELRENMRDEIREEVREEVRAELKTNYANVAEADVHESAAVTAHGTGSANAQNQMPTQNQMPMGKMPSEYLRVTSGFSRDGSRDRISRLGGPANTNSNCPGSKSSSHSGNSENVGDSVGDSGLVVQADVGDSGLVNNASTMTHNSHTPGPHRATAAAATATAVASAAVAALGSTGIATPPMGSFLTPSPTPSGNNNNLTSMSLSAKYESQRLEERKLRTELTLLQEKMELERKTAEETINGLKISLKKHQILTKDTLLEKDKLRATRKAEIEREAKLELEERKKELEEKEKGKRISICIKEIISEARVNFT
jgi:hypothetical protein